MFENWFKSDPAAIAAERSRFEAIEAGARRDKALHIAMSAPALYFKTLDELLAGAAKIEAYLKDGSYDQTP